MHSESQRHTNTEYEQTRLVDYNGLVLVAARMQRLRVAYLEYPK